MAQVSDYGDNPRNPSAKKPMLYARDVEGAPDVLTLTIMSAQLFRQNTLVGLETLEYPGFVVWVPRGPELRALVDRLGRESSEWAHRMVVLEKVRRNNPRTGDTVEKYVVAPADVWDELEGRGRTNFHNPAGTPKPPRRVRPMLAEPEGEVPA